MYIIGIVILIVVFIFVLNLIWHKNKWIEPNTPFLDEWRIILAEKVIFYYNLPVEEKVRFEYKIQEFLLNCRITGIDIDIDITDKILVASSAVIPIFGFDDWRYTNLYEVLLYPEMFNDKFETAGSSRNILGMVGTGYMEGKMIISKPALHHGFENETDKSNTAIHEFVHLIDKYDGSTDGIPDLLLEKQYVIPWLDLMNKEIGIINSNKSEINPYGGTNQQEFFAVASEYFFEQPKLLAQKHPLLYELLEKIFKQKMTLRNLNKKKLSIGRNSPCPCNSGLKFKKCCGKPHYN